MKKGDRKIHALVVLLRALVGDEQTRPSKYQLTASLLRLVPSGMGQGPASWLVWCLLGLDLLSDDPRSTMRILPRTQGVLAGMLMMRSRGNVAVAARMAGTSRKTVREQLRKAGLYPWPGDEKHEQMLAFTEGQLALLLPPSVEDGTRGLVFWTLQDLEGSGPAWLELGDRSVRLFRGWWVDRATAEAYANMHGHTFDCEGERPGEVKRSSEPGESEPGEGGPDDEPDGRDDDAA